MKPEFIKLDNCSLSIQRVHTKQEETPNLLVIDEIDKRDIKKGSLVVRLSHVKAIELIKQLSQSILDTPF